MIHRARSLRGADGARVFFFRVLHRLKFFLRNERFAVRFSFRDDVNRAATRVISPEHSQERAAQRIVPGVRHHARTQAAAPPCQQSEHQAVERDQHHARYTLVAV